MCFAMAGAATLVSVLPGCASIAVYKGEITSGKVAVPATIFAEGEKIKVVRSAGQETDILLVKVNAGEYRSLKMQCTHINNRLVANNSGLTCPLHGSAFSLTGDVVKGPAARKLDQYKTTFENETIFIHIN